MFFRSFFIQALWNFERLQNVGFLFIIKPFIDEAYSDKAAKFEALARHAVFFNTHPYMANVIAAVVSNVEGKKAKGDMSDKNDVNFIKSAMSGPLAAIGDSFFWGTLRPLMAFIAVFLVILFSGIFGDNSAFDYGIIIPLGFFVLYNSIHIPIRSWLMFAGFKMDKEGIALISKFEFRYLWEMVRYTVLAVITASIVLYFIVYGFGSPGLVINGGFWKHSLPDAFIFGTALVLSFILIRFGATWMFYLTVILCIAMSFLGI